MRGFGWQVRLVNSLVLFKLVTQILLRRAVLMVPNFRTVTFSFNRRLFIFRRVFIKVRHFEGLGLLVTLLHDRTVLRHVIIEHLDVVLEYPGRFVRLRGYFEGRFRV